jgi:regulator of protease activity HflC (stomatin/prohibitin superfamily)
MKDIHDRWTPALPGFLILAIVIAALIWGGVNLVELIAAGDLASGLWAPELIVGLVAAFFIFVSPGFVIIKPNESAVLIFFGSYLGTVKRAGYHWVIPFTSRQRVSRRVVNFNTEKVKVNDASGNPIEIGAVIVWRVADSARAVLNVDNYRDFVEVQAETAIRALASRFPYDSDAGVESLRGSPDQISADLKNELSQRLEVAGIEVREARLSHLAYAPEIASAMLRRQQAEAVVRARRIITENAVDIVNQALKHLEEQGVVSLDGADRTRLVNNLLVALVSERDAQPVMDLNP